LLDGPEIVRTPVEPLLKLIQAAVNRQRTSPDCEQAGNRRTKPLIWGCMTGIPPLENGVGAALITGAKCRCENPLEKGSAPALSSGEGFGKAVDAASGLQLTQFLVGRIRRPTMDYQMHLHVRIPKEIQDPRINHIPKTPNHWQQDSKSPVRLLAAGQLANLMRGFWNHWAYHRHGVYGVQIR